MDDGEFEKHFGRRAAAHALREEIDAAWAERDPTASSVLPGDDVVAAEYEQWLPQSYFNCLKGQYPTCQGPGSCGERCAAAYWREHSEDVAVMLENLATALGEDRDLWRITGLLHDLDYLKGPHHDPDAPSERAHPVAISRWMFEFGMPQTAVLAVLEHSPHLGMPASSKLSHALIACDEHATMTADGQRPHYPSDIPQPILGCLSDSAPSIDGFVRNDMLERATVALRALAA